MSLSLFQSSTIPILAQVVDFAQSRHEVLAGNIANYQTPGYRTRDLSVDVFRQNLKEAIETRDRQAGSLGAASPSRVGDYQPFAKVKDSLKGILYHDDSNVSLEHQVTELIKNQGMHNTALTILRSQFRLLQVAISERVT